MYNWSTDISKINTKEKRAIWKLEQMVNFGLGKSKISKKLLGKYWNKLNIEPARKRFLEFILWNRKSY